jgi:hypothetical protein
MKMKVRAAVVISSCLVALLLGTVAIQADAGDYLGDYCWNFSNATYGTSGVLRLGVTHIGGGHLMCSGTFSVIKPFNIQGPTYGNIEVIENKIRISLSLLGMRDGKVGTEMHSIALDPATLNGTETGIGVFYDAVELFEGTLTYTTCP